MKRIRALPVVLGLIGGVVLITSLIVFEAKLPGMDRPDSPAAVDADPLLASHNRLMQISNDYRARLESMDSLSAAKLLEARPRAEDLVVSSTAKLLRDSGTPAQAASAASARLNTAASTISGMASRLGIALGPRMSPELLRARIKDPQALNEFAAVVFEFQTAACVSELARAITERDTSGGTAPPAGD